MIHTNINKVQNWLSHYGCECDTDNEIAKVVVETKKFLNDNYQNKKSKKAPGYDISIKGVKCFHCKVEIMMENFGRKLIYYVKKIREMEK